MAGELLLDLDALLEHQHMPAAGGQGRVRGVDGEEGGAPPRLKLRKEELESFRLKPDQGR